MLPRAEDVVDVVDLLLVQLAEHLLPEDLREADDGVQRRPQLVGHARQEFRLVAAGALELLVEAAKLVVHEVDVVRQHPELIPVSDGDVPCEIARGDIAQARLDLPDGSYHGP